MRLLIVSLLFTVACAEAEEAALDHAQILAVRLDPPIAPPGVPAKLDILVGDTAGNVFEVQPTTVTGAETAQSPLGWMVWSDRPAQLTVTATIDDVEWSATKRLLVGEPRENPTVEIVGDMTFARGTKPTLSATAPADVDYAWYSSVGVLTDYRQPVASLEATTPAEGLIVVVVRDHFGGVAWQLAPARVD